jgi:hypothetical protein
MNWGHGPYSCQDLWFETKFKKADNVPAASEKARVGLASFDNTYRYISTHLITPTKEMRRNNLLLAYHGRELSYEECKDGQPLSLYISFCCPRALSWGESQLNYWHHRRESSHQYSNRPTTTIAWKTFVRSDSRSNSAPVWARFVYKIKLHEI